MHRLLTCTLALALASSVAKAAEILPSGDIDAGRVYAEKYCTECHDIGSGARRAPRGKAPDFRAVANAKTTSELGLNAFLTTTHPSMPNFIIAAEDRRNVVAYILSLKGPQKVKTGISTGDGK